MLKGFLEKARDSVVLRIRVKGYPPKLLPHYLLRKKCETHPIFICGMQRSGTNMLADCFDNCRNIEVQHDISRRAYSNYRLKSDHEVDKLIQRSPATHIVFKPLLDIARVPNLLDRLPNSFTVWIYRNYKDVILSMARSFGSSREELDEIMAGKCTSWRRELFVGDVMASISPLYKRDLSQEEALALSWLARNEFMFARHMDMHSRVALVNYDAFVRSPREQFNYMAHTFRFECNENATKHVRTPRNKSAPVNISREIEGACEEMMEKLINVQKRKSVPIITS
jgi:hypothetical protein